MSSTKAKETQDTNFAQTLVLQIVTSVSTVLAFIVLTSATFSAPFVKSLNFLHTSKARGVSFGVWGWCLDKDNSCIERPQLGYTWEPEIPTPITKSLVLYPMASVSLFFFMVASIPMFRGGVTKTQWKISRTLAVLSWLLSSLAFIFAIAIFATAQRRFTEAGFSATFGPLPALSLLATLLLAIVSALSFRMEPVSAPQTDNTKDVESHLTSPKPERRSRRHSRR